MIGTWGRRVATAIALLAAVSIWSPAASALVVHQRYGRFLGLILRSDYRPTAIRTSIASAHARALASGDSSTLDYHGGPVLHSSAPYLIFWTPPGEAISPKSEFLLGRYFTDLAADSSKSTNVFSVGRQYTDGSGFVDYRQTFTSTGQALVDTQPYPSRDTIDCPDVAPSYPSCITDAQLQTEIARLIEVKSLPTGIGPAAPIYFVVTPGDVNVCSDAADCADNVFCGYHGAFEDQGATVLYAAIPLFIDGASPAQDPKLCQHDGNAVVQEPNRDLADVAISYLSHDDSETLTDPLGTAWWDSLSGNEDGDNCISAAQNANAFVSVLGGSTAAGTLYDQIINGDAYYTQSEWSNGEGNCEMRPTAGAILASFNLLTGTTAVGMPLEFIPGAGTSTQPASSVTWQFGDGTTGLFSSGATTLIPVWHPYTAAGRYEAALTLVDSDGNLATATEPVVVGSPPIARFSSSPADLLELTPITFDGAVSSDPDPGIRITSYRWSFGDNTFASDPIPRHAYARAGYYTVTLIVTDTLGLTGAASVRLKVASFQITKVATRMHQTGATIFVTVNGPGRLRVARKTILLRKAGTVRFEISLTTAQRRTRARKHKLVLRIRVHFAAHAGQRSTRTVTLKFRR